jgi:hypothetical protein
MKQQTEDKAVNTSFKDFIKDIFDHFRNLGICAAVIVAGRVLLQKPELSGMDYDFTKIIG